MSRKITAQAAISDYFNEVKLNGKWVRTTGVGCFESEIVGMGARRRMVASDIQLALVTGTDVHYDADGEHEITVTRLSSTKMAATDVIEVR